MTRFLLEQVVAGLTGLGLLRLVPDAVITALEKPNCAVGYGVIFDIFKRVDIPMLVLLGEGIGPGIIGIAGAFFP